MPFIEINNLTKDFGEGRGLFNLNLSIERGEVFGFVGINGAGKTTTIRHMMGFLKPKSGTVTINGMDCWTESAEIKKMIGYIPGEIAFPDAPTGTEFLKRQAEILGLKDMSYAESIIKKLQLDPTANLKRMSKGMKQKTAIVAALMADPEILILDEPTTGLDPLMRSQFVDILNEEKKKGKTIFMSSHMFEEVEHTCDKVALIKGGQLIAVKPTVEVKHNENKEYKIEFLTPKDYERFLSEPFQFTEKRESQNQVLIKINDRDINLLFTTLKDYPIKFIVEKKYTLADYFNGLYEGERANV
ncbi:MULTISPECIES: ATP-binding cassette domain-containing protein [unclassified Paenibacillus]|uniref:ABC transporter ATP-binding protein n=1 Tax=Paenibacillus provencensis TaxID=441151 RepID=A0ABW3PPZ0_9BACL|nr:MULTISPECIES: ATP-binding cassette domain-containing protein [unclassified Paenibacillus]MCM3129734.1 ATP-binding cassette domain-containing protein [Paenibacillus sp. MER 78]SFS55078.1 ABC-2 type transport system ATP-binding protein [Paenibacillus sp. 453mf]